MGGDLTCKGPFKASREEQCLGAWSSLGRRLTATAVPGRMQGSLCQSTCGVSWSEALGITALGTLRGDGWRAGEEGSRGLLVSCIPLVSPGPLGRGSVDDTVEFHLVA